MGIPHHKLANVTHRATCLRVCMWSDSLNVAWSHIKAAGHHVLLPDVKKGTDMLIKTFFSAN